jgi:hypothetical protein
MGKFMAARSAGMEIKKASSSFFEKKEPKKLLLRFAHVCHRPRHIGGIKVFFASFLFTKKRLFLYFAFITFLHLPSRLDARRVNPTSPRQRLEDVKI